MVSERLLRLALRKYALCPAVMPVRVGKPGRSPTPRVVTTSRPLDLDYIGAEVAHQLGRHRTGQHPAEIEDANASERPNSRHDFLPRTISSQVVLCFAQLYPRCFCYAQFDHEFSRRTGVFDQFGVSACFF